MIMFAVFPGYRLNTGLKLISPCVNTALNYNPEFIAQAAIVEGFTNPDVVLIGRQTEEAGLAIGAVYDQYSAVMPPESAEQMKISLNCFVTTKIAYANLIADIADQTLGRTKNVLVAIGHDSRVGTKYFQPGWAYGGCCFPRDRRALAGIASRSSTKQ
jgi:UDP-glucose 6-dehydrogenase